MALITNFYNGDMARPIRETILQNFANLAKYVPHTFLSLSSTDRENLKDDYKTYFKFVFDTGTEYVYRWSDTEQKWETYLIRAKDEYARQEAADNREASFAEATLGVNINGDPTPYAITFYNRDGDAKDDIFLTAANILYDANYSVETIIDMIRDDIISINNFIGDRNSLINNPNLTSTTITSALNEINDKAMQNASDIAGMKDGSITVGLAARALDADHATNADLALDSNKLGGQLPSYYATQSGLDTTNANVADLINRVTDDEQDITNLDTRLDTAESNITTLQTTVGGHTATIASLSATQTQQGQDIQNLQSDVANIESRIGWEILT